MANVAFSPFQFNEIPIDFEAKDEAIISSSKDDPWFQIDENGFMDLFSSVFDHEINTMEKKSDELFRNTLEKVSEDVRSDFASKNVENYKPRSFSLTSWNLLKNYGTGLRIPVRDKNWIHPTIINETEDVQQKLSTNEILRIAGERFIQFSSNKIDGISTFIHPYGSSLSGLSMDDARDVEIIQCLLSAAEHVAGNQRLDLANELISRCLWMASGTTGTPIQRLAFYFAGALQEKMNTEHSGSSSKKKEKSQEKILPLALGSNNTFIATHQELPFAQVMQFAAVQTIIENVRTRGKIHLIDLQIRSGIHCTTLMQGLADNFKVQSLRLTAVTTPDCRSSDEETCKRLLDFALSLNFPFSFEIVCVNNFGEFSEDMLSIEKDETVAIYANIILRTMISKPDIMENVMRVIRKLKPAIMVVIEVEASHNSPSFIDRFIEVLLFYSAFFDCLEDCMERDNQYRMTLEGIYFGKGIMNIVATDGEKRVSRSVKLDVWRAFFPRFRMVELELSESARYQASLVLKRFANGKSCNLECSNGKGIIVGWKGTPLISLTAWKFL